MKDILYLTMNSRGVVKMTKSAPSLSGGEIACKVIVNVDGKFFHDTFAKVELTIDADQVIEPEIDVEVEGAEDDEDQCGSCGFDWMSIPAEACENDDHWAAHDARRPTP